MVSSNLVVVASLVGYTSFLLYAAPEGLPCFLLQLVPCLMAFLLGYAQGGRSRCNRCCLSANGPETKLCITLDLAKFKDVREEYLSYQKKVSESYLQDDGDDGDIEAIECEPTIELFTAFLCGCASMVEVNQYTNELLNAASKAIEDTDDSGTSCLSFEFFEAFGKKFGCFPDGGSLLEEIHYHMRAVDANFLSQGPNGLFKPCVELYIVEWYQYRYISKKLMRAAWKHSAPAFEAPYSCFMQRKDGVWHLQDVFKVKTEQLGGDRDQLWNFFHC